MFIKALISCITACVVVYMWWFGKKENLHNHEGWSYIFSGVVLIFFGDTVDKTNNFAVLNDPAVGFLSVDGIVPGRVFG